MRKLCITLLLSILTFSCMITDVQAKRFGGGKSFGVSRQSSSYSRANVATPARAQAAAKPATSGASKWLGPLAGLAVGGLLASLFMGHGVGSGILSWLLIGGLAFLVWRFIRNRMQPATAPHQNLNYRVQQQAETTAKPFTPVLASASATQTKDTDSRIANFDETQFLRNAKAAFIRLQAAYDNKDIADIREFTTPEVFAEIQLQLHERGDAANKTEVVSINAELLDLTVEGHLLIASVQFSGLVREEVGATPVEVKEIWHLHKFDTLPNWMIAGIQQA